MLHFRDDSGLTLDASAYNQYSASISTWHDKYRSTKSTLSELEYFFKARADLEEEFSQRLQFLAQQPLGDSETGDTFLALKSAKRELIEAANSHKKLSSQIREELQQPALKQASDLSKLKRQQIKSFLTKQQSHFGCLALLERAKERCQEANQIGSNEFRNSSDTELQLAFARLDDVSHSLKIETDISAEEFQRMELSRLKFIKNAIWKYTNMLSGICVADDESLERIRVSLERFDIEKEVSKFFSAAYPNESNQEVSEKYSLPSSQEINSLSVKNENNSHINLMQPKNLPSSDEAGRLSDTRKFQPVSSSSTPVMVNMDITREKTSSSPIPDRSKAISHDLFTSSIARSPIFAAKRTSSSSRPSSHIIPQRPAPAVASKLDEIMPVINKSQLDEKMFYGQQINSDIPVQSITKALSSEYTPDPNTLVSYSGRSHNNHISYPQVQHSSPSNSNHVSHKHQHTSTPTQSFSEHYPETNAPATSNGTILEHINNTVSCAPPSHTIDNVPKPDSRPILFYVRAIYDYVSDNPEEISLHEGQIVAVFATQLDGWWEGQVEENDLFVSGIFPSNFTEPVSL